MSQAEQLAEQIKALSVPDLFRLAAMAVERNEDRLAETVAQHAVRRLQAKRLFPGLQV